MTKSNDYRQFRPTEAEMDACLSVIRTIRSVLSQARGLNDALNDMTNKLDTRRLGELVVGVQVLRETVTDLEKMLRPFDREQPR